MAFLSQGAIWQKFKPVCSGAILVKPPPISTKSSSGSPKDEAISNTSLALFKALTQGSTSTPPDPQWNDTPFMGIWSFLANSKISGTSIISAPYFRLKLCIAFGFLAANLNTHSALGKSSLIFISSSLESNVIFFTPYSRAALIIQSCFTGLAYIRLWGSTPSLSACFISPKLATSTPTPLLTEVFISFGPLFMAQKISTRGSSSRQRSMRCSTDCRSSMKKLFNFFPCLLMMLASSLIVFILS